MILFLFLYYMLNEGVRLLILVYVNFSFQEKGGRMHEELAFLSYSVAYDIFYKASPVSPLLGAVFALETFILHTLLHHFSRVKTSNLTTQLVFCSFSTS